MSAEWPENYDGNDIQNDITDQEEELKYIMKKSAHALPFGHLKVLFFIENRRQIFKHIASGRKLGNV
jgi:hypothetical protein